MYLFTYKNASYYGLFSNYRLYLGLKFWAHLFAHGQSVSKLKYIKAKEPSIYFLLPLVLLGLFSIFSGYFFKDFFINEKYAQLWTISNVINISNFDLHHKIYLINFIPTVFAFFGIILIFYFYFFKQNVIFFLKKKFSFFYQNSDRNF